jgi:hypothetical protein
MPAELPLVLALAGPSASSDIWFRLLRLQHVQNATAAIRAAKRTPIATPAAAPELRPALDAPDVEAKLVPVGLPDPSDTVMVWGLPFTVTVCTL